MGQNNPLWPEGSLILFFNHINIQPLVSATKDKEKKIDVVINVDVIEQRKITWVIFL